MLPDTTSLTKQEKTERCPCCEGDAAVRVSRDPSNLPLMRLQSEDAEVDVEMIECHVCGYAWYEIDAKRPEAPSVVNVFHDVSVGVPGQPRNAAMPQGDPSLLVTAKPTNQMMVERIRDIDSWMRHYLFPMVPGGTQKVMSEQMFSHVLNKRMEARRAVARQ